MIARLKTCKDSSELWFGVTAVESSIVNESAAGTGVRVPNVVEERRVEYVSDTVHHPGLACVRGSSTVVGELEANHR